MSCIQQQSPTPVHGGIPALRITTDIASLRKASFEEINSAPVTRKELGYQDLTQHRQNSPSVAFTSNNWRSTMVVPSGPPGTSSSSEDPSPERIFSNEDALANTSGSSEHRVSPVTQGNGTVLTPGRNGSASSPLVSEAGSGSTSGGSTATPPVVNEGTALARIISHGYSTVGTLSEKAPGSADRVDIFEVLPAALNFEGKAVCHHHKVHGPCDCEAFPLVKITIPSPMPRSNRVCYPIQEVDESPMESQPITDAGRTPIVSPTTAKAREDNKKRQLQAERFEALLGKLRKSAPIKERKDATSGGPERLTSWNKATNLGWDQRVKLHKDEVRKESTPTLDRLTPTGEQPAVLRPIVPKQPKVEATDLEKSVLDEPKTESPESKLQTVWNPKAKEFSPPKGLDTPAGKAAGAKARELLSKFVSEAKSRDASRGSEKKNTNLAGSKSSPPPFVSRASNINDALTSPFGVAPSLAQMVPGIPPLALPGLIMPDTPFGGLGPSGLGNPKFDFNPFNGLGALGHSLGAAMTGTPGLATPGLAGLSGVNLGPQRPASQAFPGALNAMPPAPSRAPPGPVPKPRLPDTQAQQEYEQWIEWRKANEPGYALECKARQARRAQRTKTTAGSLLKSDLRGSTNGDGSSASRSGDSKTE